MVRFTFGPRPAGVRDLRIRGWIEIEFEVSEEDDALKSFLARELIDRIVDASSVIAGVDLPILHWQVTSPQILRPQYAIETGVTDVDLLRVAARTDLQERHYRAMRHLRRGLAQTSPERRFGSLMLAVEILSRFWEPPSQTPRCATCGQDLACRHCEAAPAPQVGLGAYVRNLSTVLQNWTEGDIQRLWNLRSAVTAHGNEHLSAARLLELVEASMDAAQLAYDALNASLPDLDLPGPPPTWFMTDVFLLEDSIVCAHTAPIHVSVLQGESKDEWIARWPPDDPQEFRASHPLEALEKARQAALEALRRRQLKDPNPDALLIDAYQPIRRNRRQ